MAKGSWTITFDYRGKSYPPIEGGKDTVLRDFKAFKSQGGIDTSKITKLKLINPDGRKVPFKG